MIKPDMRLTLQQVRPPLPDPCEFSEAILESIRVIDEHPDATIQGITDEMLELWSVSEEELDVISDRDLIENEELYLSPSVVSSLIIFSYIYAKHYRGEDFADFDNLIYLYRRFQKLINMLRNKSIIKDRIAYWNLLRLDNVNEIIDDLNRS